MTLRFGSPADQRRLARLAELDSSTPPAHPVLLAEVDGQLRAALALTDAIATSLEQFAFTADRPRGRVQTLPSQGAVRPNQETLIALAQTLRRQQPYYARGVAMLELLLSDGTGPAYTDSSGMRLACQLEQATQGLGGCAPQPAA